MSIIDKAMKKLQEKQEKEGGTKPGAVASHITPKIRATKYKAKIENSGIDQCRLHIDRKQLINAGLSISTADGSLTVDNAFRRIKRPILANAFGKESTLVENGNIVMICSSLPGEGKTFNAINLAMSIAIELDKTVLLVDADLPKRTTSKLFDLEGEAGLTDVLVGDEKLSDVVVSTDLPDFKIIPAGKKHTHGTELLASDKMFNLIEELAHRYPDRVIIFDTPPLLITSEAQVIAGLAGQVVLVIEADRTLKHDVEEAVNMLDKSKPIGLVLNKTQTSSGSDYYGDSPYGNY